MSQVQPQQVTLTKIARLATVRCFARWQLSDKSIVETPLMQQEYDDLATNDIVRPKGVPDDAVFLFAAGGKLTWDTPDGRLPLGGYDVLSQMSIALGVGELNNVIVKGTEAELLEAQLTFSVDRKVYQLANGALQKG